jgi:sulfoxide reductase heme-binding subunit YedZ
MKRVLLSRWTKVVLFLACLIPAADLAWKVYQGNLANPVEYITHTTGDWIIRFLLITLSVTPLRMILNQPQLTRFRRMFGLFAFAYGMVHFATWFWLDKALDFSEMGKDVVKRPFITAGMTGLALMIPLAITSTAGWVRRLGFKRWQALHRLVYVSATAGVIHYYWLVKSDVRLPLMYAGILAVLLGYRVVARVRKKTPVIRVAETV